METSSRVGRESERITCLTSSAKWKQRYRDDAEFRERVIKNAVVYRARKLARCPAYDRLLKLRNRRGQLRESIRFHTEALAKQERRLIRLVREIDKLAKECRGK